MIQLGTLIYWEPDYYCQLFLIIMVVVENVIWSKIISGDRF